MEIGRNSRSGIDKIPVWQLAIIDIPRTPENISRIRSLKAKGHIKNDVENAKCKVQYLKNRIVTLDFSLHFFDFKSKLLTAFENTILIYYCY